MNAFVEKLMSREALWPAVGIVASVVWLFRGHGSVEEFESWALSFGGFCALLSGGVLAAKKIAPKPSSPPACVPGPGHACPTSAPAVPGGGVSPSTGASEDG